MANSEIRSSRLQAAVEVKYTVFRPLVVEVLCVLFLDYARWLGQKQITQNFYHKQMKDGVGSNKGVPAKFGCVLAVLSQSNA